MIFFPLSSLLFSSSFLSYLFFLFISPLSFQTHFAVTFYKFLHFILILGSEVNRRFWVAKWEGILESFSHICMNQKIYKTFVNAIPIHIVLLLCFVTNRNDLKLLFGCFCPLQSSLPERHADWQHSAPAVAGCVCRCVWRERGCVSAARRRL